MVQNSIIQQLSTHFHQEKITDVVILTDENVEKYYPHYFAALSSDFSVKKMVLPAGEQIKAVDTAVSVWNYLIDNQYDRNVFLLNFGGGTICDLGGFVASTYKRGIRYANCPTTLLAMIDAAIGGKTGINMGHLKNSVGTFYFADIQMPVDISLLETLPDEEFRSGFGELVKYALIGSADLFDELAGLASYRDIKTDFLDFCVDFKRKIVKEDPRDTGLRHILNFGHTIGHAIEGCCAEQGHRVAHGVAVAQGLYYESYLSTQFNHLPHHDWLKIADFLSRHFQLSPITPSILKNLIGYAQNDKKNHGGNISFTLLDSIGHAVPDCHLSSQQLEKALQTFIA